MELKIPKGLKVAKARNGRGIFATRSFPASARLFEVEGSKVTCELDEDISDFDRDNTFRYSLNWYISPAERVGALLNHSCEPNSALRKTGSHLYIVSVRPIVVGEEIVVDYSTFTASDDIWEMRCNCGTRSCRKVIKNIKSLSKKVASEYRRKKMIPSYIN